ncbi:hypothetical protein H7347_06495 [Corynebacterium sp. zg-331]|uniref:hypothetical protein n=1 Tax=unclassified Corynebacterium TaxID=2624378 RepID=UPI00128C80E7|nr:MULTISPECIES: hypothetical protein [unclassified Corynebacterium]MBC3186224.1 hypothetical protein [Corynebacterium sp. zg-331]MPV52711.1 hypothetical protein [Corynebacterium sp. zg331]
MRAYGLGELPGVDIREAASMVLGETGDLVHLPQLPRRGLDSHPVGRTAALLPGIPVDRGPRGWVLRPGNLRLSDRLRRDVDACEEVWAGAPGRVKVQVLGPWSLAAGLETPGGHRAFADAGALRDLTEALIQGIAEHAGEVARRMDAEVIVQIDEPLAARIAAGAIPGTHDFDRIAPVSQEDLGARWHEVIEGTREEILVNLCAQNPPWAAVRRSRARTVVLSAGAMRGTALIDALGEHLDAGLRLGVGVGPGCRELPRILQEYSPTDGAIDVVAEGPFEDFAQATRAYRAALRLAR